MEDRKLALNSELNSYLSTRAKIRMGKSGSAMPDFTVATKAVQGFGHATGKAFFEAVDNAVVRWNKLDNNEKMGLALMFSGSLITLKGIFDLAAILSS